MQLIAKEIKFEWILKETTNKTHKTMKGKWWLGLVISVSSFKRQKNEREKIKVNLKTKIDVFSSMLHIDLTF